MIQPPQLDAYDNLRLPDYEGDCLVQIPTYIKYLHGAAESSSLHVNSALVTTKKTVLFMVDGFGYKQWQEQQANILLLARFGEKGTVRPLTSMFPSSTAPSTAAFATGLSTQQHGLIEWFMYEQKSQQVIATLPFRAPGTQERGGLVGKVDPSVLLSSQTLYEQLAAHGTQSYVIASDKYAFSPYSTLTSQGATTVAYGDIEELFANLHDVLLKDEDLHAYVYWDAIDTAGHKYGPDSPEYAAAVATFFKAFNEFLINQDVEQGADVQLMITADHGQIAVDPEQIIWLDEQPFVVEALDHSPNGKPILPWGMQRDVYLKVTDDKLDSTITQLRELLADKAVVLKSQEALQAGLFGTGTLHPDFQTRIGNILIIATANNSIWYRHTPDETFVYKGMHGALTTDEVQIPFAECSLRTLIAD